ncbi:MAG: DMT family transporter [Bacteroidota bacterium]|nr:DMT family transporter [Bacteroidota bacterium]
MIQSHIGEFAALLVAVFWTVSALAFESAGKAIGSLVVNLLRLVFALVFLSVFTLFYRGLALPVDASAYQWTWLSLSGLVGFVLGDLFLFKSFTIIGSRLAMLIMTLAPPITALTGWLLLDERLGVFSIFGIILTISGIALTTFSHNPEHERLQLNMPVRGFLFALGGALGQAFGLVLSKKGMAGYDPFAATQIRIIVGIVGFSAIVLLMGRVRQVFDGLKNRKGMAGTSIGALFGPFLGVSLSLLSIKYTSTGVSATIMSTTPILIIFPAILLFKQKVTVKEVIGSIISVIGVAFFFI